jgi:ribose transport system substrate-binding protein
MAQGAFRRKAAALALALGSVLALAGCGAATSPASSGSHGSKIIIGFSQSYTGNSYRKELDRDFVAVAKKMEARGEIAGYDFLDANNSVSTQISQIDDLILKHVSIILIDPASPTALNGVIAKAIHAGIPVLVFNDGPVTSTLPYQLNFNNFQITGIPARYIAQRLHGHGNVLEIRGIAGTETDIQMHQSVLNVFSKYPGIKIVGSVYGNWTETVAESAVAGLLPSLPKVDAIVTQGGEGYGAIQAFQAAGRPIPLVVGGNRGYFLHWWWQEYKTKGYQTISESANPWIGGAAVYVALDILHGKKVPKNMTMPVLTITQQELPQYKDIPVTDLAQKAYNNAWVTDHLLSQ